MDYKGDTLDKKLARLAFWARVRRILGPERFLSARFAYLASEVGGDASVLKGLGVPASQQLAIDHNPDALKHFQSIHPDVPTELDDAGDRN